MPNSLLPYQHQRRKECGAHRCAPKGQQRFLHRRYTIQEIPRAGLPVSCLFWAVLAGWWSESRCHFFANVFASSISLEKREGCVSQRCISIPSLEEGLFLCSQLTQSNRKCNDAMGNCMEAQSCSQRDPRMFAGSAATLCGEGCRVHGALKLFLKYHENQLQYRALSCPWLSVCPIRAVLPSAAGSLVGWIIICSLEWNKGTGRPPEAVLCGSWVCHSDSSACSTALTSDGSIDTWRNRPSDFCRLVMWLCTSCTNCVGVRYVKQGWSCRTAARSSRFTCAFILLLFHRLSQPQSLRFNVTDVFRSS